MDVALIAVVMALTGAAIGFGFGFVVGAAFANERARKAFDKLRARLIELESLVERLEKL